MNNMNDDATTEATDRFPMFASMTSSSLAAATADVLQRHHALKTARRRPSPAALGKM
jgi:hypothetical protein